MAQLPGPLPATYLRGGFCRERARGGSDASGAGNASDAREPGQAFRLTLELDIDIQYNTHIYICIFNIHMI